MEDCTSQRSELSDIQGEGGMGACKAHPHITPWLMLSDSLIT